MRISGMILRIACLSLALAACLSSPRLFARGKVGTAPVGRATKEAVRLTVTGGRASEVEEAAREVLGERFEFTDTGEPLTLETSCTTTRQAGLRCTIKGTFKGVNLSADNTIASKDLGSLAANLMRDIADQIDRAFPMASRISFSEKDVAVVDMGENVGLKSGQRLRVYSEDGDRLGLLRVETVGASESETHVLRGRDDMREGLTVVREGPFRHGVGVEYRSYPVDVEVNPSYTELTGEDSETFPDIGSTTMLTFRWLFPVGKRAFSSRWGVEVGTGYTDLGALKWWEAIEFNVIEVEEILPDVLSLEFSAGASAAAPVRYNWARPEGIYDDRIGSNRGETKPAWNVNYHGSGRVHLFMTPGLSLVLGGGYYRYTGPLVPADSSEPSDDKSDGYDIDKSWLEYDFKKVGGFTFQAGLEIWLR